VQLEEKASSPARAGRKAKSYLAKARRILQKARGARTAASAAGKAAKAAGKVRRALALFGEVTNIVVYEWMHCDSVGWAGTPYVRGLNCRLVLVDGYPRRYVVYVPTTGPWSGSEPAPALMMLHGTGGTGERFLKSSGWKEKADEVGLVPVFPTGLVYYVPDDRLHETKWNKFHLTDDIDVTDVAPGYPTTAPWPADDVGFLGAILDDLEANLMIDAAHIYATGFSNGAAMTGRLAYELSDRLAAVAYSSSIVIGAPAPPLRKIPILNTLGAEDDGFQEKFGLTPAEPIPLDPATFLAFSQVQLAFGEILDNFELEYDPHDEVQNPHSTAYRFATPKAGNTAGNVFAFVLMEGLIHHYPVGPLHPDWNPYGFNAPDLYWDFFLETTWP
jgi:poly(3-hydroxybutyrate) depolymerase